MTFSLSRVAKAATPAAALAATVTLLSTTPALADTHSNVVPGADQSSVVVHTDTKLLTVTVDAADAAATEISGKVTNTSDKKFTCAGPRGSGKVAGDVTTSKLVAESEDYYRKNTFRELPKVPIQIGGIPIIGNIPLGQLDLGMFGPLLQGLGGLLGDPNAQRNQIAKDYSTERVKGHAGLINAFTVEPGATHEFSVYLNNPSSGPRTDFDAAAFIMCTDESNAAYAFTGYEEGTRTPGSAFFGSPGLPLPESPGLQSPGLQSPGTQAPDNPETTPTAEVASTEASE